MTTGSNRCSISSIIPMSCRNRAEAFARRLHSRLSSLGSEDGRTADETTWLANHENSVAVSQPRHSDPDLYFDFALLDLPGSPEEEVPHTEFSHLITNERDNLNLVHGEDCHCSKQTKPILLPSSNGQSVSPDSESSDGQYFDPDTDEKVHSDVVDGVVLGDRKRNTSDSLSLNSLSCTSDEESTLSLQDYSSLDYSSCLQEYSTPKDCSLKDVDLEAEQHFLTPQESNDSNEIFDVCCTLEDIQGNLEAVKLNGETCDDDCDIQLIDECQENGDISEENNFKGKEESCLVCEQTEAPEIESYSSNLRIENNLTLDLNGECDCNEVNEVHLNIQDEEIVDHEEPTPRVRRCSSLKTGKTPPGTPSRKKIVRFADVLGLDLADVRTFLDEIPKVPNSAYADLQDNLTCSIRDDSYNTNDYKSSGSVADKILVPLFQQPGGETDFLDRVKDNQVCLENAIVDDPIVLSITGTVRVRNLDFNKTVHIRYSLDSWKSHADLQASYVDNSCDGFSDKFSFLMYVNTISIGQRLEFAVRFQCKGAQYWDNNKGVNYCFQCLPGTHMAPYAPITGNEDSWGAAFY